MISRDSHIKYLLGRKYPLNNYLMSYVVSEQKPDTLLDAESEQALKAAEDYRNRLIEMTDEDFKTEFHDELATEEQERFYNESYAKADYVYWARQAFWTLEESAFLSFGKNPKIVNQESLERHEGDWYFCALEEQYKRLRETLDRAHTMREIYSKNNPVKILEWFISRGIDVPDELIQHVEKFHRPLTNPERNPQTKQADQTAKSQSALIKEIDSLSKLVLGLSLTCYRYDPNKDRHPVSEIVSDLQTNGIKISGDTVRKHLRNATEKHYDPIDI